jgi:uncharacterized protein YuzE
MDVLRDPMEITELIISYDREVDVAYLSFGKPRPSVSEEVDDYVLVRRDPKTNKVTGVTIVNFSPYFDGKNEMKVKIPERVPRGRTNSTGMRGSRRACDLKSIAFKLQKQTSSRKQVEEEIEWAKAGTRKAISEVLKE